MILLLFEMYNKLPKDFRDFIKFLIVGGLATVVDVLVFNIFALYIFKPVIANDDLRIVISNIIAFIFGLITNFLLSRNYFFKGYSDKSREIEFIIFTIIGIIGFIINTLVVWILFSKFGIIEPIAKFVAVAVSFMWNFIARKIFLYRK